MNASGDVHYEENKEISVQVYKYFFLFINIHLRYPWFKKKSPQQFHKYKQHISSTVIHDLKR